MQTTVRLLLKEQPEPGLHRLPFHPHPLGALLHRTIKLFHFLDSYGNHFGISILSTFTVVGCWRAVTVRWFIVDKREL